MRPSPRRRFVEQPRLRAHFHAEVIAGEGVFLLSEHGPARLYGDAFEHVVPLLDGTRSATDIAEALAERVPVPKVLYALALLEKGDYLEDGPPRLSPAAAIRWAERGVDEATAAQRLGTTPVSVTAIGGVDVAPLVAALESLDVRVGSGGDLAIVVTDDYLRAEVLSFNASAIADGRPWLLVKPVGREVWLGPLFDPAAADGACAACLTERLRSNREIEVAVQDNLGRPEVLPIPRSNASAQLQLAYGLAAETAAGWIVAGAAPHVAGQVISLDPATCRQRSHRATRQPFCASCGDSDPALDRLPAPIELAPAPKRFTADGGHRIVAPEVTLEQFGHLVSPITGILAELRRADIGDDAINVYVAGDNRAVQMWSSEVLRVHFRSKSGGKGVTDAQARASGLCEAIERYSGYFRGYEPRRRARLAQLGEHAIHPHTLMQFSARQYRERARWNATESRFNRVPLPFDDDAVIDWSPVRALGSSDVRFVPTALVYYAYPAAPQQTFFRADSNGNAAGNCVEEAILQGFLELAERDAMALWWYNRVRRPGVDLDSFDHPYPQRMRSYLARHERQLLVLDITNDLGIPAFCALSRRTTRWPERIIMGFGAHLDPTIALLRSITELNQMLTWVIGTEIGLQPEDVITDPEARAWVNEASFERDPYLCPDPSVPATTMSDFTRVCGDDLRDDVEHCRQIVERLGTEMLVLDQTRADIGMPVVKVIVPGLRHCHGRLAPGRLYDAPVELGWLPERLDESALNPVPIFL